METNHQLLEERSRVKSSFEIIWLKMLEAKEALSYIETEIKGYYGMFFGDSKILDEYAKLFKSAVDHESEAMSEREAIYDKLEESRGYLK